MTNYVTGSGQSTSGLDLRSNDDTQTVSDGGFARATLIGYGATQTVTIGGQTIDTNIYPSSTQYVSGGTATGTDIGYQGTQMVLSGRAEGTYVLTGGTQVVSPGADVSNTVVVSGGVQVLLAGASASGTIVSAGGSLDVRSVDVSNGSYAYNPETHVLMITDGSKQLTLQLGYNYETRFTIASDNQGGTLITAQCFCRGTLIATQRGEVLIEELCLSDTVLTYGGLYREVRWIGWGKSIAGEGNRPIVVRAGALKPGAPFRDLTITPRHAMLTGDVLIPVEELENGSSIFRDFATKIIEFYHIELASHDIVYANGLPVETFRDVGNRNLFAEVVGEPVREDPDRTVAAVVCAGPIVERTRRRLAALAERQSPRVRGNEFVSSAIS